MDKNVKLIQNLKKDVADIEAKEKKLSFRKAQILKRIGDLQGCVHSSDRKNEVKMSEVEEQQGNDNDHSEPKKKGFQFNYNNDKPASEDHKLESNASSISAGPGRKEGTGGVNLSTDFGLGVKNQDCEDEEEF